LSGHGTQAQLEAKLAAHDDRIERKTADMVQTLDVAKRAGLTANLWPNTVGIATTQLSC